MSLTLSAVSVDVPDGPDTLTILDRVDLHLDDGDAVVVTGPSGSGKSTLVAVAGLLRQPTSGRVVLDGVDATAAKKGARTRLRSRGIGLVFQSANLFPGLTAREQLEFVAHASGRLDGAARSRALELLAGVGLAERTEHRPAQLSGGERQRVAVARALMNRPGLVLADEPTAALDPERGADVMGVLTALARDEGASVLIVTHALDQVPRWDRHLRLERAGITSAETPPAT